MLGPSASPVPVATGEEETPCWAEQIAVTASPTQDAVGHRAVTLTFSLMDGEPCTLSGYPWVDSGTGRPAIHAEPALRGYMGGLPPSVDVLPNVLQGMAIDGSGNACPGYTDLHVCPPDISMVFTVPATIDARHLPAHPSPPADKSCP
jgi:hypothetical protein